MVILRAAVVSAALAFFNVPLLAQRGVPARDDSRLPVGTALVDVAVRMFDKSDGLQSPSVFSVFVDLNGRLWIGTDLGPMRFDGNHWELEPLPVEALQRQTRAILQASDSSYWFATRSGVVRRRGDMQTLFDMRHGLPSAVVYSVIETRALNGKPQILVGTGAGIAVFDGIRFLPVALPDSLQPQGLMLGETQAPDGSLELWLASSLGKVGRYAKGRWTVFGAEQGLTGRSAEAIVTTHNTPGTRLIVPGEGGVFEFRDEGSRGERFELIPGSPRRSYRAAELTRPDGEHELWVGNLDGVLLRKSRTGWDTVNVASLQQGGRVTALRVVPGHAGGTAVYVGTYGGRLARIAVGSVATLERPQGTRRDNMPAVLAERSASGRAELWMGTADAGLLHIDALGSLTQFSKETHQPFNVARTLALLASSRRSANHEDTDKELPDLWIGTENGPFRREGNSLVRRANGIEGRLINSFARGPLPDGTMNLMAATDSGLYRWANERWERLSAIANEPVVAMSSAITQKGPMLWLVLPHRTARVTLEGTTYDSGNSTGAGPAPFALGADTSSRTGPAARAQTVTSLCALNDSARSGRVFAGTSRGALWWRTASTNWAPIEGALQRTFAAQHVRRLSCLDDGRLVIGTSLALIVADVRDPAPSNWFVQSVVSQEDGLPATEIDAFAPAPLDGILWIGTTRGLGALQLNRVQTPPLPLLSVQLRLEDHSGTVPDGAELRAGTLNLIIKPVLITNHREYDTRYLVRLDRDGDAHAAVDSTADGPDSLSQWTAEPEARYPSLSAGRYTLRVWARDYAGRITPSVTHFRVIPPLWRTWWAILLYALLLGSAIYLGHRWRLHALERTNERLANSERKMRSSERKFRALFDEASDAHLLLDGTQITSINDAARALLGLSDENAPPDSTTTGMYSVAVLPPSLAVSISELAATGALQEYTFRLADGTEIPLSAQITQVPLDDRTLWHLVMRDLRAEREADNVRLRLEEQVRDAQKFESLGTLAGGVAHDFNNLLGVIRGNVELARDSLHDADAIAVHLDTVFDASERARDLVRQILTFSRRSSSREESVDVAALTRHLLPMLRSMIPSSVEIVLTGAEHPLLVQGDPTQLQQILLNLASNAEYAMRPRGGGRLHIDLDCVHAGEGMRSDSGCVIQLRVTDTGVGMAPEVLDRVFDPFFTTKPTGEGTGLGMAVLHGIVASHGGRVRATSVLGDHTTFEVLLPSLYETSIASLTRVETTIGATVATSTVTPSATRSVVAGDANSIHIVLVDDEPTVAHVGEAALSRMGYRVTVFADPAKALAFVRAAPGNVDLVVTDQTMPGITGDLLTFELHQLRADLPVIIMSGFSYVLTPDRLAEVGAQALLQKPVSLSALRAAVELALEYRLIAH